MRLAWLLTDLVRHGGGVEDDGAKRLPVDLSAASMALWIRASRRAVDRALAKWRARGAVTRRDGKLVIRDLAFLARTAVLPSPVRGARRERWRPPPGSVTAGRPGARAAGAAAVSPYTGAATAGIAAWRGPVLLAWRGCPGPVFELPAQPGDIPAGVV
jgi:Crp-like helix-turn-helix domain